MQQQCAFSSNKSDDDLKTTSQTAPFAEQTQYWAEYSAYYEKNLKPKEDIEEIEPPQTTQSASPVDLGEQFTHFDNETSQPKQVDISEKPHTNKVRVACATAYIQLNAATFAALSANKLKKGNALLVSQIAGIQASKQTAHLIPLCHQINLDACDITFRLDKELSRVYCTCVCKTSISKTGVEMEALTACSVSLLCIYDMCKAVQKDACINELRLEYKYGGSKSDYVYTRGNVN